MLTRLKLKRGEGKLVVASPQVISRTRRATLPQYPLQILPQIVVEASASMSREGKPENMSEDKKSFRKSFFDMTERSTWMKRESSNIPNGYKSSKGE